MHVVDRTHAIQPIQHTHQGEEKKKIQLGLNMYFDKLMCMTTSTHLKISMDTIHECVVDSIIPKNTMHTLAEELDEGANQCTGCKRGKSSLQ